MIPVMIFSLNEYYKIHEKHWIIPSKSSKSENYYHREDGPAKIILDNNGNIVLECWYFENKIHRYDAPAKIIYLNDNIRYYWYINGENITDEISLWLENNTFGIPLNYSEWSEDHKILFKIIWR